MLNMLNAGKLELMKAKYGAGKTDDKDVVPLDEGQPDLPRNIDNTDKVDLGAVVAATQPKMMAKLLREFTKETGVKVRQIGKKQSKFVADMMTLDRYPK